MTLKRTIVGLFMAALVAVAPIHERAMAQSVEVNGNDPASSIYSGLDKVTKIIDAGSYIGGLGFVIGSIIKFKQHKDNPGQVPVGTPIGLIFVSAALLVIPTILSDTGSTLFATQSCPVFIGTGTELGESSCVWAKFSGQTSGGGSSQGLSWQIGGQTEVGPGWFLGGALGAKSGSSQGDFGQQTQRAYDGAVVVKRVRGPLYLSAAAALSTATEQFNGILPSGDGTLGAGSSSWSGGVLLRGAYVIPLDPVYLRPRLDVGVGMTNSSGMQLNGTAGSMVIDPSSTTGVQINPMLEVGGRIDAGAFVLRPYIAGGAMYLPVNVRHLTGVAFGSPFSSDIYGASVVGTGEAGLQFYTAEAWDAKLEYRLLAASDSLTHTLGVRLAKHF